ncbi:MAG: PAS domain S-box protein [Verrucomicrobia bacterium]|nr:PAS domain S-box protein [Cytophagales bacterium]
MFKNVKISAKVTGLVFITTLTALLLITFITDRTNRQTVEERYFETLNVVVDMNKKRLDKMAQTIKDDLQLIKNNSIIGELSVEKIQEQMPKEAENFFASLMKTYDYENVFILQGRKIIYKADLNYNIPENQINLMGVLENEKDSSTRFGNIFKAGNEYLMLVASPVTLADQKVTLLLALNMNRTSLNLQDTTGLGQTGEMIVAKNYAGKINYLSPTRYGDRQLKRSFTFAENAGTAIGKAVQTENNSGSGKDTDYRGKRVLAAWRHIQDLEWGIIAKIDEDEVISKTIELRWQMLWISLATLALVTLIARVLSNVLARPLVSLKSATDMLGKGVLPAHLEKISSDETADMTESVNNLVSGLKETITFAQRIGQSDFETPFKPLSENDALGVALLQMRDSIREAAERDDEQNWVITGLAEVGNILRSLNRLDELGDPLLAYTIKRIGAVQGAFYIIDDEEAHGDKRKIKIDMTASYAFNKKKYLKGSFRFAEGLVGQAVAEQDTLLRTEVPDNYMNITSGLLGDRKPKCLLVVPLITVVGSEKEVFGVIELAGFKKFTSREVRFVNEASDIIARTIFNIKVNETTRNLLTKSQKQSEELQIQQESLRQNAEEMQATQEELKRANNELEFQIEEVFNTQKRMQILLENASEVIIIYEKDATIRYVSPSVERILGFRPEEMAGTPISTRIDEDSIDKVQKFFVELIEYPEKQQLMEVNYEKKNGESIWVEAFGTNLMSDKAINGIVVNIRDITERRRAEQETRRRGQMQALSENSPDLITRFNTSGRISYINPVIETYSGISKEEFLQRTLADVQLKPTVIAQWEKVLKQVIDDSKTVAVEMDFPSPMGDRVMQVNAIPEYNQEQEIESVLVVSHDITDRKMAELEIQSKSRKITESINYAQRIQESILPSNAVIQQVFPQSFILYKPRDVVSGDFPWFMQKGDDYYIAAVDCTGHGVPGALISLIGYFLLNNIVRDNAEPGVILDELDKSVTLTLRQDVENATTRDGMDIALCKINLKTGTLQYSGAHRPLYLVKNGELQEMKGDKFPIGGGQYKSRGHFQTHTFEIGNGDAVFFCSDGYPDQFGGPDNRKLSSRRIREVIVENQGKDMQQFYKAFDDEFENWKNGYKQTDDVLMIGIQF